MNDSHDRIELRSEKIRNIIGSIPSGLVRWGTVIVVFFFALLILSLLMVPSPEIDGESFGGYMLRVLNPIK
ncbi:MAG: hypothetical protein NC453_23760 [Muribaculum sp.]|nr:hypothetical protein [Muribaculum sp.]